MSGKKVIDWFVPVDANDYSPHIFERASIAGMFFLTVLTFTMVNMQSFTWTASKWMVGAILPAVIATGTNEERTEEAIPALKRNGLLDKAATLKAQHMSAREYFSHYSPEGVSPWYWFEAVGYEYEYAGENLAIRFSDSDEVLEAWMDSPAHRENILNQKYTEIGIGTAKGTYEGEKTVYVVQLFASPSTATTLLVDDVEGQETTVGGLTDENKVVGKNESVDQVSAGQELSTIDNVSGGTKEVLPREALVLAETATRETVTEEEISEMKPMFSFPLPTEDQITEQRLEVASAETSAIHSFWSLLTRPNTILQYAYSAIGIFVALALAISILVEIKRQRPLHILYSSGLVATMFILFYLHVTLTSGAVIF